MVWRLTGATRRGNWVWLISAWPSSQGGHESVQQRHAQVHLVDSCSGWRVYKDSRWTKSRIYPGTVEPMKSCSQGSEWACLERAGKMSLRHTTPGDRCLKLSLGMTPSACLSTNYVPGMIADTTMSALLLSLLHSWWNWDFDICPCYGKL